ncbi:MAG: Rpn family recombination-promoting nuclease/putative transposase [Ktedonobacteraceae bacterium]
MPGDWDDSLKMFIGENAQDFVSWLFEGAEATGKLLTEFKKRTVDADALIEASWDGDRFLAHFEFQSTNDPNIAERLLEYNFEARRAHKLPVYSCVIYLKNDGDVPKSPLAWTIPNGQEVLRFHYLSIEFDKIVTGEIRQTGRVGLLPLMLLTKDGARHEVVEEIITRLEAAKQYNLLPITELLASLVFKSQSDQEWLERTFVMLKDRLQDTPAYQRILKEGRERGLEEGLEKGLEKGRLQALQQELQRQREILHDIIQDRFPKIGRQAKKQADAIKDPAILKRLIISMVKVSTAEEAKQLLLDAAEEEA